MTTTAISGLVLAGGQSRRMGRDKAALEWQGGSLLMHMRRLLLTAGADPVRVSGDYPAHEGIVDVTPGCGPLGGLASALVHLPDGPAWIVPVDMPRLSVSLLHELRDAHHSPVVIFSGQPLPMRLNIDLRCRTLIMHMIDQVDGPRALRALQERLGVIELPVASVDFPFLANCNTPQQWKDVAS